MKKLLPYIPIVMCCSCATLMNTRNTQVTIATNTPARVVMDKDTFASSRNRVYLTVPRKKEPFSISVFNDSVSKKVTIHPGNSGAYWLNIYATAGLGMLADKNKLKRYGYPERVTLDMNSAEAESQVFMPVDSKMSEKRNCLKITPLRFLLSHPGFELSYERYLGKRFSAQVSWARLYDYIEWSDPTGEGYQLSAEGKYFDVRRNKDIIPYVSLELGYFDISIAVPYNSIGNKRIQYLIPKLGMQQNFGSRLIFDVYFGLGIKHQMGSGNYLYDYPSESTQDFWDFRIASNFKVGWRF